MIYRQLFLILISLLYTEIIISQVTIGDCNTGGVTATGGYADFNDADANYTSGEYNFTTPVNNQTIITYHLVNSGTTGSIGFDISHNSSNTTTGQGGCITNSERTAVLYPVGGCNGSAITPTLGANNNQFYNPEFTNLTPNTDYILVVTTTNVTNCEVDQMWVTYYSISNNSSGCNATVGTFSIQKNGSPTSNSNSYDLLPNETFNITSNNDASLPPTGPDGDQSGIGYAAFSCDPSSYDLNDPSKYNTTDMPCFLGFYYSPSMTDENNTNSLVNGLNLTSWWFVPVTFDDVCSSTKTTSPCPTGNSTSIGLDTDGDGCISTGTPIQINYITSPPIGCTTCSSTLCTSSSVTDTDVVAARSALTTQLANDGDQYNSTTINAGESVTICVPVTVPPNTSILGFKQRAFGSPGGCTSPSEQTITYELRPAGCGNVISPSVTNAQPVSSGFNPEWNNPTPGDYTLCYTVTNDQFALCSTFEINGIGYYTVTTSCSASVGDQTPSIIGSGVANDVDREYTLCYNDQFSLNTTSSNPSVDYAIYNCEPTTNDPSLDQCYTGFYYQNLNSMTENSLGDLSPVLNFLNSQNISYNNNTIWWVPIATNTVGQYDQSCYDMDYLNKSFKVTYLNEISATGIEDCANGSVEITITGGSPEMIPGENYNIVNTGSGSLSNNTTNSSVTISNLTDGDSYSISIVDDNGCSINFSGGPFVSCGCTPPTISSQPSTNAECEGSSLTLSVVASNASGYQWQVSNDGGNNWTDILASGIYSGETTANLLISDNTGLDTYQYQVIVNETSGNCPTTSDPVTLIVNQFTTTTISCGTETDTSVTFNWTSPNGATDYDLSYSINNGASVSGGNQSSTSYSVNGLNVGDIVTLTVSTNGSGCYSDNTGDCSPSCTNPTVSFLPDPLNMTLLNTNTVMINNSTNANLYSWDFGDGSTSNEISPTHTYSDLDTGTYVIKLIAYGSGNCMDSLTRTVRVREELIYYIPNTFTPFDRNDYNPVFKPIFYSGFETRNYSMQIFDRWGKLIYNTTDIDQGWDGKDLNTGRISQDGTYIFKIEFGTKSFDDRKIITGHVNLLR